MIMVLENYCKNCGHRILQNEPYCRGCGVKTIYSGNNVEYVFTPPIYDVGFFNFDIDFSPYIESKRKDFKYEICSCGYLNRLDNEFCYMCGAKRSPSRWEKIINKKTKPVFSLDNILCECGTVNSKENVFCEMCGTQLKEEQVSFDNYSNFDLDFNDSIFCFCGEENEKFSQFCKNCGYPLANYGKLDDLSILCTCSFINDVTSDFCGQCGENLKKEDVKIICVCGHKNSRNLNACEVCDRPLNPKRVLKTRIICSCGQVLDWDSEFCLNCGKDIKKTIMRKNSINNTIKSIKKVFR